MGDPELITCSQCGHEVPRMNFCIRCGHPLADEYHGEKMRRTGAFAANPDERVRSLALVSTLFPQLPKADMDIFRLALLVGIGITAGLALIGAFPVAIVTAAILVPLLMVIYMWDVDVYEDEPRIVIGATMVVGGLLGGLTELVVRALPAAGRTGLDPTVLLLGGVVLPIVSLALMLVGPLLLLPWRRFNDVLDGATFGAASGVAFMGAKLLVSATNMWDAGLRPGGDPIPWVMTLVSLGVLMPLIAAGAVGAVAAALWLRWRSPVADRSGLGALGNPFVAILLGAALLVIAGLALAALGPVLQVIVLLVVLAVALLWLRTVIHFGLLQEAREIEVGPPLRCPNCGVETPHHAFCGNCGVALAALPRRPRPASATEGGTT